MTDMVNSAMATTRIIVEAININTCAEHKPQISIKPMTNVMIDEANRHIERYLNIHRS